MVAKFNRVLMVARESVILQPVMLRSEYSSLKITYDHRAEEPSFVECLDVSLFQSIL